MNNGIKGFGVSKFIFYSSVFYVVVILKNNNKHICNKQYPYFDKAKKLFKPAYLGTYFYNKDDAQKVANKLTSLLIAETLS